MYYTSGDFRLYTHEQPLPCPAVTLPSLTAPAITMPYHHSTLPTLIPYAMGDHAMLSSYIIYEILAGIPPP